MAITDLIPWKKNGENAPVRRRDEESSLLDLKSQMNRMFDEFFEQPFGLSVFNDDDAWLRGFSPRVDISETDKEITVSAELPGMEPEDIHISLDHNALTISGEKRAEREKKDKRFYRVERSYGSFQRSIPLPKEVAEDKIDATFKHGLLKVTLPKTEAAKKKAKRITVETG